jgi:hypothetical protein
MDDKEYLWYKLLCFYHAQTELYDRTLTDLRSPYDPTEAFITGECRSLSNWFSKKMYDFIRRVAFELRIPNSVISKEGFGNRYNYSAQHWIDEYNRLVNHGEMDFIEEVNE